MPASRPMSRVLILSASLVISSVIGPSLLPPERRETSGALQSLDDWTRSRAWPDRIVPGDRYAVEYENARGAVGPDSGSRPGAISTLSAGGWRSIGPMNIGGRTLCVTLDPQTPTTVWAGSASGGLWRSLTGGAGVNAWTYVPTGFPVLGVSTIAIDPGDPGTLYIGTGEVYAYQSSDGGIVNRTTRGSYGIGILKSMDGGATWAMSLNWLRNQERGVWAIRIDPANSDVVWAATTEGVYKSVNAGVTWTLVHPVIMAMDLEIDPADGDRVYVACGNFSSSGSGIYRTTNGGADWTLLAGGLPGGFGGKAALSIAASAPNTIFASIGNGSIDNAGTWLCRSTNGGDTWSVMNTTDYATYQGWYSHDVAVNPANALEVTAVGIEVWKSTAGGAGLTKKSSQDSAFYGVVPQGGPEGTPTYVHADIHQVLYHPSLPSTIYFATDGGVFRSQDGGATFSGLNGGFQTSQFYAGFGNAALDTIPAIGGMQDNYTAIYSGSPAWSRVIGGDGSWAAVDAANPLVLYGSWQFLNMLKSTDGGANFTPITPPAGGATAFIAPFILSPFSSSQIYAGRATLLRSTNGGMSWTVGNPVNGNPILSIASSSSISGTLYVVTQPTVAGRFFYETVNNGTSWSDRTGSLPNRYPMDLSVDRVNDRIVHLVLSGYGTSHMWKTTNGGITWTSLGAKLPDVPTSAVLVDPLNTSRIFVGNDIGVFASYDGGVNWGSLNDGLPDAVMVTDLTLVPSHRRLRVSTHGNGVYEIGIPDALTGVAEAPRAIVTELVNSPNPFSDQTVLRFDLALDATVRLEIFDVSGHRVRTLADRVVMTRGANEMIWDGRTDDGRPVKSGKYFARITGGGVEKMRAVVLIRR